MAEPPAASYRLICGALAGVIATGVMTATMRRLHRRLEPQHRYPLPPREIVSSIAPDAPGGRARDASILAHFAYGALCGAALAVPARKPALSYGIAGGVGIWLGSYLGWIPGLGILRPATDHPAPRNSLMILSHVAWGSAFAATQNELIESERIFTGGPLNDIADGRRKVSNAT